jgi:Tfp pilus assembly PilM family ATPase
MPPVGQQKKAYVCACRKSRIKALRETLSNLDLTPQIFTITELALPQLLNSTTQTDTPTGLMFKGEKQAKLMVIRSGVIQMIRDIGPTEYLDNLNHIDMLTLEIQRSFDFYQTALRGATVSALYLSWEVDFSTFNDALSRSLIQKIKALPIPKNTPNQTPSAALYGLQALTLAT